MSVRAALPGILAGLTAPREVATTVRGVAVGASPASTSHIDRWRSRVKRTKDLTRLRFDRQGVCLANNIHIPWSAPLSRAGLLPVLPAVCAAGDIAEVQRSVGGAARDNPWWLREAPADVVAAWPALRDLAALGVTPVALDGDRITLAVEAI